MAYSLHDIWSKGRSRTRSSSSSRYRPMMSCSSGTREDRANRPAVRLILSFRAAVRMQSTGRLRRLTSAACLAIGRRARSGMAGGARRRKTVTGWLAPLVLLAAAAAATDAETTKPVLTAARLRGPGRRRRRGGGGVGGERGVRRALRAARAGARPALALPDDRPRGADRAGASRRLRELRPRPRAPRGGGDSTRRGHGGGRRRRRSPRHVRRRPHGLRLRHQRPRNAVGRAGGRQRPHRGRGLGRGLDVRIAAPGGPLDGRVRDPVRDPPLQAGRGPRVGPGPRPRGAAPPRSRAVVLARGVRLPGVELRDPGRPLAALARRQALAGDPLRPRRRRRGRKPEFQAEATCAFAPRRRWASTSP